MPDAPVDFIAVDNHATVLRGIKALAQEHPAAVRLLGTYTHVEDIDLKAPAPAVVLLDLYLGAEDELSIPSIPRLRAWGAEVLVHTSTQAPVTLQRTVAAGALGVILKNDGDDDLVDAICQVAAGDFVCSSATAYALSTDPDLIAKLAAREDELIHGLADGLSVKQIASRCGISYETARGYAKSLRNKYLELGRDITNSHSLVREARRDGWIDPHL